MQTSLQTTPSRQESVTTLIGVIIEKCEELLDEQLALFRAETKNEIMKTKEVMRDFGIAVGLAVPGVFFVCFALVHLLHWLTAPTGTDPASVPLWACHGIMALLLIVPSAMLATRALKLWNSYSLLPEETAEALVENIQCVTKKI